MVEHDVVGDDRPGPEQVGIELFAVTEDADAIEGAQRVGPVEAEISRCEPSDQFLPAAANIPGDARRVGEELDVDEGIDQVAVVAVDQVRGQFGIVVEVLGIEALDVDAKQVLVPNIAKDAYAGQLVTVVLAGQPAVDLVVIAEADFTARGEKPVVADVNAMQFFEDAGSAPGWST